MKKIPINVLQITKVLTLALILAFGFQYVAAVTWAPPTAIPPNNNVPSPINTGYLAQSKTAGLIVASAALTGGPNAPGLIVQNGRVGIGTQNPQQKVDAVGYVKADGFCIATNCISSWPTGGGGGGAGVSRIIAGSGITVNPSGGTGDVTVSATGGGGGGGGGAAFILCPLSGGETACTEAQRNGGEGTSQYRVLNCPIYRPHGDGLAGMLMHYGRYAGLPESWEYWNGPNTGTPWLKCTRNNDESPNSVLVAKLF